DERTEKAVEMLDEAISLTSGQADTQRGEETILQLLWQRSALHRAGNKPHEAIQDLDHLLSLAPSDINALLTRAALFVELGRPDLAEDDYEQVLAYDPGNLAARKAISELSD